MDGVRSNDILWAAVVFPLFFLIEGILREIIHHFYTIDFLKSEL